MKKNKREAKTKKEDQEEKNKGAIINCLVLIEVTVPPPNAFTGFTVYINMQ